MHFYILASFFILVSIFVETSQSECLSIEGATNEETCYNATDPDSSYSCVLNVEEKNCVEIKRSDCNDYTNFTYNITEENCTDLPTLDPKKYTCVLKNEHRCIEQGTSECLNISIYKFKRRRPLYKKRRCSWSSNVCKISQSR